ncbi:MAG: hypothetical protein DME60_06330 [Verrucomicrobia bacterium]|nr:MAG: hypothetical protein DME60_06330 [Verrucomicrobiota bacterium]
MRIMKRYTLRALIHDAKIFNQLRLEYRQTKKNRRKDTSSDWLSRYLAGMRRHVRTLENDAAFWWRQMHEK